MLYALTSVNSCYGLWPGRIQTARHCAGMQVAKSLTDTWFTGGRQLSTNVCQGDWGRRRYTMALSTTHHIGRMHASGVHARVLN